MDYLPSFDTYSIQCIYIPICGRGYYITINKVHVVKIFYCWKCGLWCKVLHLKQCTLYVAYHKWMTSSCDCLSPHMPCHFPMVKNMTAHCITKWFCNTLLRWSSSAASQDFHNIKGLDKQVQTTYSNAFDNISKAVYKFWWSSPGNPYIY